MEGGGLSSHKFMILNTLVLAYGTFVGCLPDTGTEIVGQHFRVSLSMNKLVERTTECQKT